MIMSAWWGGNNPVTTTFHDLVVGQEYEVQIFTNDARNGRTKNFVARLSDGLGSDPLFPPLPVEDPPLNSVEFYDTFQLSNNPVDPVNDPPGDAQGDSIIGTFTADATTQSFVIDGSNNGGASWGNLDTTSSNFTLNFAADPLSQGTSADVNAGAGVAFFGDDYLANSVATPVSTSTLTVANDDQPQAITLAFQNTSTTAYSIESLDSFGIVGATNLTAEGDGSLTLLGTHTFTGPIGVATGYTLNLANDTTSVALSSTSLINSGTVAVETTSGDLAFDGAISGNGTLDVFGGNILTLNGDSDSFTRTTLVNDGTVVATGRFRSSVNISAGAVFEHAMTAGFTSGGTYSGDGVLRLSNNGADIQFRSAVSLGPDALIDIGFRLPPRFWRLPGQLDQ